jgi:hypothetical protein
VLEFLCRCFSSFTSSFLWLVHVAHQLFKELRCWFCNKIVLITYRTPILISGVGNYPKTQNIRVVIQAIMPHNF